MTCITQTQSERTDTSSRPRVLRDAPSALDADDQREHTISEPANRAEAPACVRKDFVLMSRGANVLDGLEYYPEFYAHDEQLELLRFLQAQRELGSDLFGSSYAVLKNGREASDQLVR